MPAHVYEDSEPWEETKFNLANAGKTKTFTAKVEVLRAGEKKKITNVVCANQLELFAKASNETYFGTRGGAFTKPGPDRIGSDRIGSDRIDKARTGSHRINKTWIGLRPVDIAYV